MNRPSRRMRPPPIRKASIGMWPFLVGALIVIGIWVYRQPGVLWSILGLAVVCAMQMAFHRRAQRRLAASRKGDSICSFARSFDRQMDTWIIRSVYEELSRYISIDDRPIPVRRQDHCEKDLGIDMEDLDDLTKDMAFRAQRSLKGYDTNPIYGKVETVGDLVAFLDYQAKIDEPIKLTAGGSR